MTITLHIISKVELVVLTRNCPTCLEDTQTHMGLQQHELCFAYAQLIESKRGKE